MKKILLAVFPAGALLVFGAWHYDCVNSALGSLFDDKAACCWLSGAWRPLPARSA